MFEFRKFKIYMNLFQVYVKIKVKVLGLFLASFNRKRRNLIIFLLVV